MKIFTLDSRCLPAMEQVKAYYMSVPEWQRDIAEGKMFGVLIYEGTELPFSPQPTANPMPEGLTFLAAFSGTLGGCTCQQGFVPPIFDIQQGEGGYFLKEEAEISAINHYLDSGRATPREVCDLRHERKERSRTLQRWLFSRYRISNIGAETSNHLSIFAPMIPPGGAGDCCAPKLLQEAFRRGIRPLAVAEWNSVDGEFCPPCTGRCRPILGHMLRGLDAEHDPRMADYEQLAKQLNVVWEDESLMVVNKPSGLLSVPGKEFLPSVESITGCLSVHRLDQDTSGLLVLAKNRQVQSALRLQFEQRRVEKRYEAILEHEMPVGSEGDIRLPLRPDINNRPRQIVDTVQGKSAVTHYRVVENISGHAHILLYPHTGRTHQLRVHCAEGLGNPILGDRLYGHGTADGAANGSAAAPRLMLHADLLSFEHPVTGEKLCFSDDDFCHYYSQKSKFPCRFLSCSQ